jgi:hypothetical protein
LFTIVVRGTWYDEEVGERIATGALRPRNDRDEGGGTKGAEKPSYREYGKNRKKVLRKRGGK